MDKKLVSKLRISFFLLSIFILLSTIISFAGAGSEKIQGVGNESFAYISPLPGAKFVSTGTTIAFRMFDIAGANLIDGLTIDILGSMSGHHPGEIILAGDNKTAIFKPQDPFIPNETVTVSINHETTNLQKLSKWRYTFQFYIADVSSEPKINSQLYGQWPDYKESWANHFSSKEASTQHYLTAPANLPEFTISGKPEEAGEGLIFIGFFNYFQVATTKPYALILDNNGEIVYYTHLPIPFAMDFKKQPNGLLTMFSPVPAPARFYVLNNSYQLVKTIEAGNGYTIDNHDLQLLENGHALFLIHDSRTIDMSQYVEGGNPKASVIGCIIQEVDADNNVIFEWRSWDHISILDTNRPLTDDEIRYIHCNSVAVDFDGNILISSRHLDEVTKIDRDSGNIIWRLGGKQNDFEFLNDVGFNYQHDARRLANGHLTVYDNGIAHVPAYSRGVEYVVDELSKSVTRVAEFRKIPDHISIAMGNVQRLPNGNTIVGWGRSNNPMVTEYDGLGKIVLEMSSAENTGSYRVFRFPWDGFPTWPPKLVAQVDGKSVDLFFSWNGSTETTAFIILGSQDRNDLKPIGKVNRHGFETVYHFTPARDGLWYFKVVPIDKDGKESIESNLAPVVIGGQPSFIPIIISNPD